MTLRGDGGQRLGLSAFGLGLLTDLTPPGAWQTRPLPAGPLTGPALHLARATPEEIQEHWSGLAGAGWEGTIDGAPFVVERGVAGDYRFVQGAHPNERGAPDVETRAVHHLSADMSLLLCAPSDPDDPSWWRVVLDSVLFTVALLHGYEALHAGAVATPDGGVIAITASMGGGKSTLLCELLGRGLTLMADDVLVLEPTGTDGGSGDEGGTPLAHPAPPLMTVPVTRLPLLQQTFASAEESASGDSFTQASVAEPIVSIVDEHWIGVPVYRRPLPLRALVVLNRAPSLAVDMYPARKPLPILLDSLLSYPRSRTRESTRFEMAATIANHVPIWQLDADPSVSPDQLADRLLSGLDEKRTYGPHPDVVGRKQ